MAKNRGKVSLSQESPEFFKVYLPNLSLEHLHIPPAFVKVFGGNIPNTAILRDIKGKCCHVELEEIEKDVFVKKGWKEFVTDHSVEEGDFLVFKYDGKVLFDVDIFGRSGCRKDESLVTDKTIIHVKREEDTNEELTKPPHDYKPMQMEFSNESTENSVSRGKSRRIVALKSAECMSDETASFVKPKNPHFIAFVGRSSIYSLYISRHVLKKYKIKLEKEMVVRDEKQRLWPMRLSTRNDGRHAFHKGWTNFRKRNNVGEGDQCVFEFILARGRICREMRVQVIHAKNNPCST